MNGNYNKKDNREGEEELWEREKKAFGSHLREKYPERKEKKSINIFEWGDIYLFCSPNSSKLPS